MAGRHGAGRAGRRPLPGARGEVPLILVDTDVILDVALDRTPWVAHSGALLERLEEGPSGGFVAWHSLSNLHDLLKPARRDGNARDFLIALTGVLRVAPIDTEAFRFAASLPMTDLEDAMQVAAARSCGARFIATRNLDDYRRSPVPALSPEEALRELP